MAPTIRSRLVRRESLMTRLQNYLNPLDFLLWASEELNSNDLEETFKQWSIPVGVLLNFMFIIARANSMGDSSSIDDDVFGDYHERTGSGWLVWFATFIVHSLTISSFCNAVYTFMRVRHYRLFEANVDAAPSTPSARRVNVDSSPMSSSPLRFLSHILAANSAEARAHPDATKQVWEVAVWDPTPLCLRLFTMFSPGHVLVYWLFFPLAPLDPRPSVTVVTAVVLATLFTAQLSLLQLFFTRQGKDSALIHREVQNEYDTKFVHPSLNKRVRDAGTQASEDGLPGVREVETFTPVTFVNRGFRTNPNTSYAPLYDPDGFLQAQKRPASSSSVESVSTPTVFKTPNVRQSYTPSRAGTPGIRPPHFRPSGVGAGDGGNFGIHNHAHSPLRKPSAPTSLVANGARREGSPLKRSATPIGIAMENVQNPLRNKKNLLNNGELWRRE